MHDERSSHEHYGLSEADRHAMVQAMLEQETLELRTVGIDIGSSTSHLLFSRVFFQRRGHRLSERFMIVGRTIEWRSPILLTPFLADGTIDAQELSRFVRQCYAEAGLTRADVDTGAVILTGEAIKRKNARAIDEIFASESGKFVCATAGHRLECILAAHGSGATALSRARGACGLHVDIGGGTTKLALIDKGEILSVAAFAVGGRLLARDDSGSWTRVDESAELVGEELGIDTSPGALAGEGPREQITRRLAELAADQILGVPLDQLGRSLQLTEPLERPVEPEYITFSGGVAEYISGDGAGDYGDIARALAAGIIEQLGSRASIPVADAGQRIRATVIGASQFSVQVSGKTIHLSGQDALPVQNVPVVHLGPPLPENFDPDAVAGAFLRNAERQDVDTAGPVALSFSWTGPVTYRRLAAIARAIATVAGPDAGHGNLLILVVDADIARSLGELLTKETGLRRSLIVLDGIELSQLDYVDIGEFLNPPGVVPVVIKSLLFLCARPCGSSRRAPSAVRVRTAAN